MRGMTQKKRPSLPGTALLLRLSRDQKMNERALASTGSMLGQYLGTWVVPAMNAAVITTATTSIIRSSRSRLRSNGVAWAFMRLRAISHTPLYNAVGERRRTNDLLSFYKPLGRIGQPWGKQRGPAIVPPVPEFHRKTTERRPSWPPIRFDSPSAPRPAS
jgi:hypothetical protein